MGQKGKVKLSFYIFILSIRKRLLGIRFRSYQKTRDQGAELKF